MNDKSIEEQHLLVERLVEQKRLKEALAQLESFLWSCNAYELSSQLETIKTSYQYMLQYMGEGACDPDRPRMYNSLLAQTLEVNDRTKICRLDESSNKSYHQCRRSYVISSKSPHLSDLYSKLESFSDDLSIGSLISPAKKREIIEQNENTLHDIFMVTWGNTHWSNDDVNVARRMLDSDTIPVNALCLMTSAVTLSLISCFDIKKFEWLTTAYLCISQNVAQRAIVGIAIALHIYQRRTKLYPEIDAWLSHLDETTNFTADMMKVYQQILLCQETEKISRKMREEIIPEVMKTATEFKNKIGFEEDDDKDEKNPEWEEFLSRPEISERLKEMNELQMEGADVQMSTFANLKSFNFFKEIHHWFYPFDKQQKDVEQLMPNDNRDSKFIEVIVDSGIFCDSDKYSLFFILQQINPSQREMMFSQLTEQQTEELMNGNGGNMLKRMNNDPKVISNRYLQDLYRFFKLYFFRQEFTNIFNDNIALHRIELLKRYINNETTLAAISTFHLRKEHWKEAAEMCREIVEMGESLSTQAELYQKMGYALQKSKHIDEAIEAYTKADTIKPDTLWTDKRLATCYRLNRNYNKALEYYNKVSARNDNNPANIYYTGCCLVELERYDEALNTFFKLDFCESDSVRAWRGIAWCSFILCKYEQAIRYYMKIIEKKPATAEYINAGHTAWSMGNIKQAAKLYGKAASMINDKELLIEMFNKDKKYLADKGISDDDIALMIDML